MCLIIHSTNISQTPNEANGSEKLARELGTLGSNASSLISTQFFQTPHSLSAK